VTLKTQQLSDNNSVSQFNMSRVAGSQSSRNFSIYPGKYEVLSRTETIIFIIHGRWYVNGCLVDL
jgi:hypothetical protein